MSRTTVTRKTDQKGRVLLPRDFANHLVIIERLGEDDLRIRKAKAVPRRISLATLLAGITPQNIHAEIKTGHAVGGEVW